MRKLDFNRKFFARSNAYIYKLALMFTNYGSTQMDVMEFLFFAHKDAVVDDINWLTFLEDFNEKYTFTNKWIQDLDNVSSEDDWFYHSSALKTKFFNCSTIKNPENVMKKFKDEKRVTAAIHNGSVLWNNMVYGVQNAEYIKGNEKTWFLWDTLLKIRDERTDFKYQDKSIIEEFEKLMHHRKVDGFYIKHKIAYNGKEDFVASMKKNLEIVVSKNQLENTLSIKDSIKKIFKV